MESNIKNKVRAIILRQGKIAITQSKRSNSFMLPGGAIENEESEIETIRREISEELGIQIDEKDINGPFFQREFSYEANDDKGNNIVKSVITTFYFINTEQNFDKTKMHLTRREKARGSKPYWVNPAKLEYFLTEQRDKSESQYARRYAREFLSVYRAFEKYLTNQKEKEVQK